MYTVGGERRGLVWICYFCWSDRLREQRKDPPLASRRVRQTVPNQGVIMVTSTNG